MKTIGASDYHDVVQVSDPTVSPGDDRVAFVRTVPADEEEYEATVYVVPTGGDEPQQFTVAEGVDAEPRWSPSGDRLAFVSTRGADDDRAQLWVVPTGGGEARRVTRVVGGVSDVAWSPDGERIAFLQQASADDREADRDLAVDEEYEPEEPDPRVVDRMIYRAGERYFDGKRSHVYVANLADDGVERVTAGEFDHHSPVWDDDGALYYASNRSEEPDDTIDADVFAHDVDAGEEEHCFRTTDWEPSLAATGDGRVAYTHTPEERASLRQREVAVYDRTTGETTRPTADLDRTVAVGPEWGPDGEELYFLTPDEGTVTLWSAPGDASEAPAAVVGDGTLSEFSVGSDAVAYAKSEWDHPGDVFASTRGGAETRRLTRVNADYLEDRAVGQPEELRFESESGDEIQGWVLTPPGRDPDGTYPLAVEIHGGPHAMWSTSGTMWHEFQTLAASGYVVFWCNPRGSTGYGEAFAAANERDWGDVTASDVLTGVDAVCERDCVDEDDLFVTGGSFGGYMTSWLVGHTDRFDGAVTQRGVYDLASFYGSTDAFKLVEGDFDAVPWEEPEFLWERSPVAYAAEVDAPTLVMHADNDFRVPVNNAEMLYLFLRKNGVDTRFVRYPREGHELSRSGEPGHVVDRIERTVRWFDGYSDHADVRPALERDPDAALSTGDDEE